MLGPLEGRDVADAVDMEVDRTGGNVGKFQFGEIPAVAVIGGVRGGFQIRILLRDALILPDHAGPDRTGGSAAEFPVGKAGFLAFPVRVGQKGPGVVGQIPFRGGKGEFHVVFHIQIAEDDRPDPIHLPTFVAVSDKSG